jgi:hypothetical protein
LAGALAQSGKHLHDLLAMVIRQVIFGGTSVTQDGFEYGTDGAGE